MACEYSGRVRDAFLAKGHDAVSCDLDPTDSPGPHHQGDVKDILYDGWDMLIAFPPCTYLAQSGMHWTYRGLRPWSLTRDALEFVRLLMNAPIKQICIENPVGIISKEIRKADQIIQPYEHGHRESKRTCLWLKNLPLLQPTKIIKLPPGVSWVNRSPSQNINHGDSAGRAKDRSLTYKGIAKAMADQWGSRDESSVLL